MGTAVFVVAALEAALAKTARVGGDVRMDDKEMVDTVHVDIVAVSAVAAVLLDTAAGGRQHHCERHHRDDDMMMPLR